VSCDGFMIPQPNPFCAPGLANEQVNALLWWLLCVRQAESAEWTRKHTATGTSVEQINNHSMTHW